MQPFYVLESDKECHSDSNMFAWHLFDDVTTWHRWHSQNRWERRTREDDSWPWRYHKTLLTSGMLLQQCQETLAEASILCCQAETHMSIRHGSKSVSLPWTKILKLWTSARNYVDGAPLLPSSSKLKELKTSSGIYYLIFLHQLLIDGQCCFVVTLKSQEVILILEEVALRWLYFPLLWHWELL